MRKFIRLLLWFFIPISLLFISGLFLPTTPRASTSLLLSSVKKDSLLKTVPSPRLLLVGGSNVSFSLVGQMIKDSLHINPINTAIHASIGLKYMLDNTIRYVKEGDTIVLMPEYDHFFNDYNAGSEELLRVVFDVNASKLKLLNISQMISLIPYIPRYTFSKFKLGEYFHVTDNDIYGVNSFDQYGDAYKHWGKPKPQYLPYEKISGEYNPVVIQKIKDFQSEVIKRKAVLFISFPGYQDSSYLRSALPIKKVEEELTRNNFKILGSPERYIIPDSLTFDTPYHLQKKGAEYRTKLFIADFKKARLIYKKTNE